MLTFELMWEKAKYLNYCSYLLSVKSFNILVRFVNQSRRSKSLQPTSRAWRRLGNRIPSAPQPLPIEKQMYKISCKKFSDVCPAGTTAAMLLMMKITTSSPTFAKPYVSCWLTYLSIVKRWKQKSYFRALH